MKYLHPLWKTRLTKDSNPHSVVLASLDDMLQSVATDAIESKKDARLETATGQWLDEFGDKFGVFRKDNEDDDTYRQRIINYILIERGTVLSIEDAIKKYLNDPTTKVEIYEPYKNVFILNKSKLNGEDHLLGKYYTTAVIDARFTENVPLDILSEIEKFKPAGVKATLSRFPNRLRDNVLIQEKKIINIRNLLVKTRDYSGNDDPWSYNPASVQLLNKRFLGTKITQTSINWGSIRYNVPSIVARKAAKVGDTITYSQSVRVTNNSIINGDFATGQLAPFSAPSPDLVSIETDSVYGRAVRLRASGFTFNRYITVEQPLSAGGITSLKVGQKYRVRFMYRVNSDITMDAGMAVEFKGTDANGTLVNPFANLEVTDVSRINQWVEFSRDVTITAETKDTLYKIWIRKNGSVSVTDIELTRLDTITPMPVKFFCDGSSMGGTTVGTATANWQMLSITVPLEQKILDNNGKLRFEVDQIQNSGNVYQTAAQTLVKGNKPLMYTAAPEDIGARLEDYDIQDKVASLIANRERTYVRLANRDIIGYKRVSKMYPLIPLVGNESKPYPKIKYGNKDYLMVPLAKIKEEDAHLLYYQTIVKGGEFDNKEYYSRYIEESPVFKDGYKESALPTELVKNGYVSHVEYLPSFTKNIVINSSCNNVYPLVYADNQTQETMHLKIQRGTPFFNQDYLGITCLDYRDSFLQLGQYWEELVGLKVGDKVTISFDINSDVPSSQVIFFYYDGVNWLEAGHTYTVTAPIGSWSRVSFTSTIPAFAQHTMWRIRFPRVETANGKNMRVRNICINKGDQIPYEEGNSTQKRGDNLDIIEEFVVDIKNK